MSGNDSLGDKITSLRKELGEKCVEFGRSVSRQIRDIVKVFVLWLYYQVAIVSYFLIWSRKTKIRNFLRYSALAALSLSSLLLLTEICLEITGREHLLRWLHNWSLDLIAALNRWRVAKPDWFVYLPNSELLVTIGLLLFLAIVALYLLFHNIEEAGKPEHEYRFARGIHSLLLDSRVAHRAGGTIPILKVLELCHFIFRHARIRQVTLHLLDSNILRIRAEHIWPPDKDFQETPLQPGEGLAGKVFGDEKLHIQYAPRLRYPINRPYCGWIFPHTVKLRFLPEPVPKTGLKLWRARDEGVNHDGFKQLPDKPINYRSLLSVPVVSVVDGEMLGVLNLDFSKTDPLDKADIAMAAGFALVLGGEIKSKGIAL